MDRLYTRIDVDLNAGAGGKYIFTSVTRMVERLMQLEDSSSFAVKSTFSALHANLDLVLHDAYQRRSEAYADVNGIPSTYAYALMSWLHEEPNYGGARCCRVLEQLHSPWKVSRVATAECFEEPRWV